MHSVRQSENGLSVSHLSHFDSKSYTSMYRFGVTFVTFCTKRKRKNGTRNTLL